MKPYWMMFAPVWAPEGDGGGGSGDGEGDGQSDGDDGSGDGAGGGSDDKAAGMYDFRDKSGGDDKSGDGDGDGDWKVPDGIPEHLQGDTADKTLSKVFAAYKGARQSMSKGEGGDGKAEDHPETADGYDIAATGDDDVIATELNSEASKPLVDSYRKAAHELGIGKGQFESFMRKGLEHAQKAGVPIGVSNEDASRISGEAQLEALVGDVGRREASTMMNTIHTLGDKMVADGIWNEEDMGEWIEACGTAGATKAIYKLMVARLGEKPIPMNLDGMDGEMTPAEAQAQYAKAQKMTDGAEKTQAMAQARAAMDKAYGTEPRGGSMRSSVL